VHDVFFWLDLRSMPCIVVALVIWLYTLHENYKLLCTKSRIRIKIKCRTETSVVWRRSARWRSALLHPGNGCIVHPAAVVCFNQCKDISAAVSNCSDTCTCVCLNWSFSFRRVSPLSSRTTFWSEIVFKVCWKWAGPVFSLPDGRARPN